MRKRFFAIFIMVILFVGAYCNTPLPAAEKISEAAKTVNKMQFERIKLHIPQVGKDVERYVLPNGIICFMKPDKSLPIIDMGVIVKAGQMYEEKDKHGQASLCATLLRVGGTKNYAPDKINDELDYRDIQISFSSSADSIAGGLSALSKDFDTGLKMFADMLMNPAFDKEKFGLEKLKSINYIDRIKDNPPVLASERFSELVYNNHPYGWRYKKEVVEKINTDDLAAWHKKYFTPDNVMLTVSGDFDVNDIKKKLNEIFGGWQKKEIDFPEIAAPLEGNNRECLIIDKKIPQSFIKMGHLGIKADNPDVFAIALMNEILGGGGFSARLMSELREKRGLTYGAYSGFQQLKRDTGLFSVGMSTSTKNTAESVSLILGIIEKLKKDGVTDDELRLAKDSYINTFAFSLTPTFKVLSQLMNYEYYNLPKDRLSKYVENIEKVTKEDVLRAAREYLHPEKMKIVIVGDAAQIQKDMEKIAPVTVVKPE